MSHLRRGIRDLLAARCTSECGQQGQADGIDVLNIDKIEPDRRDVGPDQVAQLAAN